MNRQLYATLILFAVLIVGNIETTALAQKATKAQGNIALVETSMGSFEIELYPNDAPKTVENFVKLAEQKFFDGQRFHRVAKNFVIQAGDDKSKDVKKKNEWGRGGKSIWGREFEDELNPNAPSYQAGYLRGVVAMANRGPNTNTSQFFIMLRDNPGMPKNYTIFGKVIKGMDVVEKIGQVEIEPIMGPNDGRPKVDVVIKKIRIVRSASGK
jgi:cyclophilin family peptidyl-prolyl cis-trans isomerase